MSDSLATVPRPEVAAADSGAAEPGAAPAGRRRLPRLRLPRVRRPRRPGPVAALLVVALLVAGLAGWLGLRVRQDDRRQAAGEAAVGAASEVVELLWTVDASTSKDVFATLLAGSTGPLRSQLSQASGSFQQVLTQQKVSSTGAIVESGLTELDGDDAVVLVAANATITDAQGKNELRQYRMRGTLERIEGRWLVANLEFVP